MISVRIKALNPGEAKIQAVVVTPTGTQTIFVQVTGNKFFNAVCFSFYKKIERQTVPCRLLILVFDKNL